MPAFALRIVLYIERYILLLSSIAMTIIGIAILLSTWNLSSEGVGLHDTRVYEHLSNSGYITAWAQHIDVFLHAFPEWGYVIGVTCIATGAIAGIIIRKYSWARSSSICFFPQISSSLNTKVCIDRSIVEKTIERVFYEQNIPPSSQVCMSSFSDSLIRIDCVLHGESASQEENRNALSIALEHEIRHSLGFAGKIAIFIREDQSRSEIA